MESSKILQADVLDIIFEKQNKKYGAYELRKNYHKRVRKAMIIVATLAFMVSSIPLIAGLLLEDGHVVPTHKPPVPFNPDLPPVPPPVIPPVHPPTPPPANTAQLMNTKPVITRADSVADDELPQKQKDLSQANFGAKRIEGPEGNPLQPGEGKTNTNLPVIENPPVVEKTYDITILEQLPEFPGGEEAMMAFLKTHLQYPKRALEAGENGKVVLEFVVDKEGKISEIDFLRKAGFGFDDEAKRVMGLMPEWKPGKINGQAVKARYQIPIVFELEE